MPVLRAGVTRALCTAIEHLTAQRHLALLLRLSQIAVLTLLGACFDHMLLFCA